ncbi:LacI family DNA-binding transcriptional regulator [Thioclava kandeliae]|uniref:LacI family DNA-binding transcriptional regulator n=1 Tax=Thioclava kandeliae TaxID=3070818 RepID=A0ABV1SJU3_9RHOB
MSQSSRPTLRQLAKHLDLSVTTVSRALKNGAEVNAQTIARVQSTAEALGYIVNRTGQALRTGRSNVLAAMLPLETRSYLSDIARLPLIEGMTIAAQARGYALTVHSSPPEENSLEALARIVSLGLSDGIIITRMLADDPRPDWLAQRHVPFVSFGRSSLDPQNGSRHDYIDIDNAAIAREATKQLIAEGHRRIALQVLDHRDLASQDRINGYCEALTEGGLQVDPDLVCDQHFDMERARASLDRLLDMPTPPSAMVCVSELGLLGALAALRRRNLLPEHSFELISRDNTGMANYLGLPVRAQMVDMVAVGQALAEALITRIETPQSAPIKRLIQPASL